MSSLALRSAPGNESLRDTKFSTSDVRGGGRNLLSFLLDSTILHPEEWDSLSSDTRDRLKSMDDREMLLRELVDLNLLNAYQAARVQAGSVHGLVLGNYRVLSSIGSGGTGIVFMAEHLLMRRKVAIKVLPINCAEQRDLITRFSREVRCVANLNHPNIVTAFDAGVCPRPQPDSPDLYYFVMEHLTGKDLEQYARERPLAITEACSLICQAASALEEAHQHQVVHRDIKPSNLFVTHDGQVKLLDFGLVRHLFGAAMTTPDVLVGTLEYMAPEQAHDPTAVDIRADIYSLGATLFYALTGRSPFPQNGNVYEMVLARQTQQPLSTGSLRDDIPDALDKVLNRMMAHRPADRYATPQAVVNALAPFVDSGLQDTVELSADTNALSRLAPRAGFAPLGKPRVLVVDHDSQTRGMLANLLSTLHFDCIEVSGAEEAIETLRSNPVELVLLAFDLSGTGSRTLLRSLRDNPPCPNLKVVITTRESSPDQAAMFLSQGADDYLDQGLSTTQILARVQSVIRHKLAQDRTDRLSRQLLELNVELERGLNARTNDLVQTRNAFMFGLARLVEYRSPDSIAHLARMQRYCVVLAQEAAGRPGFASQIDQEFILTLECCTPLHDIGNVGLPDAIVLKAGRFEPEERELMQTHTLIGADILRKVVDRIGPSAGFLEMAIDIARHHHEHFDGTGYPHRLAGDAIPLAARIVAVADFYDSLRTRRAQRPGHSHSSALQVMAESSPGKLDPLLLNAFQHRAFQIEQISREKSDRLSFE